MKTKQYIVIGSVVVLMGILLSLDIKGLVKEEDSTEVQGGNSAATTSGSTAAVSQESISAVAKQNINASLAAEIEKLEKELKGASDDEALALQKQLAQKWEDVNQPLPAAFAYEAIATKQPTLESWLKAGDKFTEGYQNYSDTTAIPGLIEKAKNAYSKALELNKESLEAQTGLGVAYVSEGKSPMQGIQMLLAVVQKDPKNLSANLNLGLFSMKSGQFNKAVDRFKTVISVDPKPEAYFYLATSYENLGMKKEAIAAYEKSKELAADPGLTNFVDRKVKELSN
ncbi:tetratricopeptide repeat protein [Pedobacter puniceum]|uniref:Tetratricopeptide repeat protein n=1 Tax=Pedobacter puniceum TaxID=2666136 RepID=A0A7K0FQN4_9SPHI|nr:tetratricopeptide repeat protein [Pedobacter puniceum]MRX47590.1 tetratricopeptide repeat protein [Pedobacter puniceum]